MPSIKRFLTFTIIAIITLVNFVSSLRGYRESMLEAEQLFNEQLLEYALLVNTLLPSRQSMEVAQNRLSLLTDPGLDNQPGFQSTLVFQIFNLNRELVLNFNTRQLQPVAQFIEGYSDVNFDGYRWHTLSYFDPQLQRWVITAQRDDIRYALAERVILESVLPIVLGIPVTGILVWIFISMGLRPVSRLAGELAHKEATDLSPVELPGIPAELQPLRDSINELLERLYSSFEREKRFAADAAHELRTPISVLKVQLHNLMVETEQPGAALEQLKSGIDRMGHLVEQILDLNRTAPDLYVANFEALDLHTACQQAVSESYGQFARKQQELELLGSQAWILGDRFALAILLKNLLSNAAKYSQAGGHVVVQLIMENQEVILTVVDNGPGIPATERGRALERFYRVGGDRHESAQPGCGLGLAIVKHIVDLHQATIALDDAPGGQGLRVTIRFHQQRKDNSQ